jgi:hypothetical protein
VLNVNNFHEGKHTRNVFKDPIHPGDKRIKVSWCMDAGISGFMMITWASGRGVSKLEVES